MVTASVISGRAEVGEMVQTWLVALQLGSVLLGMLKSMVSAPGWAMRLLASWIAALRVHLTTVARGSASQLPSRAKSGVSAVELTAKVTAWAGLAVRSTQIAATTSRTRTYRALALCTHIALCNSSAIADMPLTLLALFS